MCHNFINDELSLLQKVLESYEFIDRNFVEFEVHVIVMIKMLYVSLEGLEWEINDKAHSKIMSRNTTTRVNIKLMEFVMP